MRRIIAVLAVCTLLLTAAACDQPQARAFAQGARATSAVIETGIDTAAALCKAGEISDEQAARLAESAQKVNDALGAAVDFTLEQPSIDEGRRAKLQDQISQVIGGLRRLVEEGTIPIKNQRTRLVFDLSVAGARAALANSGGAFIKPLQPGVSIPVDAESRALLEQTRDAVGRNRARLREALVRLKPEPAQ